MSARQFPVLMTWGERQKFPDCPRSVPWSALELHEEQAKRNHGDQDLETLARRGGLAPTELWCVVRDERYRYGIKLEDAVEWLRGFVAGLEA